MVKRKETSGITLIALVITIIVLLVLAGISIMMLTGQNSILNRAGEAKEKSTEGQEIEAIQVAYNGLMTNYLGEEESVQASDLEQELKNNGNETTVEDEDTDFKITYTSTNNVYYLRHLLDKSYSANGSIFLDTLNDKFNDDNSILYGHHMRNGSMFASIDDYKEQEYYDNHPVLWLLTPTQNYQLKPFAGLIVSPDRTSYFITDFDTKQEKVEYMKYAIANSEFKTNVKPNSADRLVTLATCDYTFTNARFILLCILIPCIS